MKKLGWLLLPLGGCLSALCLIFPKFGFLQWITLAPALSFFFSRVREGEMKLRRAYLFGFSFFFAYFITVYHWFVALYPMSFAGVTKAEAAWLVFLCWFGLSLLQTVCSSFAFLIFSALMRGRALHAHPLMPPLTFAAIYAVFEWLGTLTFAGVPLARLSLGQIEMGFLPNSAALFGTYLITFSLVAVNALLATVWLERKKHRTVCAAAAAMTVVLVIQVTAGAAGYLMAELDAERTAIVAAVQGNVGSSEKWNQESSERTIEIYERYTAKAAEEGAVLVVFPETFLPYSMDEGSNFREYIRRLATTYDVIVQCGGFAGDEDGNEYNAVMTVYPDGHVSDTMYKKRRLVPFGEFVPYRNVVEIIMPSLSGIGMLSSDLRPGTDSEIVETEYGRIASLICFDSIYEVLTIDAVQDGAELITLPTNDSWFTDSAAAYMHNAQARFRAIESNRYIVRAADTGISCIIDARGDTADLKKPMIEGMSIGKVHFNTERTLYSRIGNLFIYILIGWILFLVTEAVVTPLQKAKKKSV